MGPSEVTLTKLRLGVEEWHAITRAFHGRIADGLVRCFASSLNWEFVDFHAGACAHMYFDFVSLALEALAPLKSILCE